MAPLLALLLVFISCLARGTKSIGVCYGKNGNNLPSDQDVISLYKSSNIQRMRIYTPDQSTLQALRGSNMELIIGVTNEKLQPLADASAAKAWIQHNVVALSCPRAENAGTYYKNMMNHVSQGTPRRSGRVIEAYRFAMFDENQKAGGIEQHWGLFFPFKQAKSQFCLMEL